MGNKPNVREVERRTYMAYHQDGILDIFAGTYVLVFGLGLLVNALWDFRFGIIVPGIMVALLIPIWIAAKRKITLPRIGFVKFGASNPNRLMAVMIGLGVLGTAVLFVFMFATGGEGIPLWVTTITENSHILVGIVSLTICVLFGWATGLKRLFGYGLLSMALFLAASALGLLFIYMIVALGTTAIAVGFVLLIRFVRKYPIRGDQPLVD